MLGNTLGTLKTIELELGRLKRAILINVKFKAFSI
jgi:hypothetical protein